MTPEELRNLLVQTEGLKLDFKREYYLNKQPPGASIMNPQAWKQFVDGQKDELIKDILALTNGNTRTVDQTAYLVIGVDDQIQSNGKRDLFDTSHLPLERTQLLNWVNSACYPPLANLDIHSINLAGKIIAVIELPPTPHVHETTRDLITKEKPAPGANKAETGKTYHSHTVFIRRGETTGQATIAEIEALKLEKNNAANFNNNSVVSKIQLPDWQIIIDYELQRVLGMEPPLKRIPEIVPLEVEVDDRTRNALERSRSLVSSLIFHSKKNGILIVEGPPGSGKTTSLRQAAAELLETARSDRSTQSPLAIYINLSENMDLDYQPQAEFFEALVMRTIGGRSKSLAELLQNRRWIFLFDAFDEIPAIRNTSQVNDAVLEYCRAIEEFSKIHQCSVVIASRPYFSPSAQSYWSTARIQKLSNSTQLQLINKSKVKGQAKKSAVSFITSQSQLPEFKGVREIFASPLTMELLIQYIAATDSPPQSTRILFDEWVEQSIRRDSDSLYRNFEFKPDHVRDALLKIAFCYKQSNLSAIPISDLELILGRNNLTLNGSIDDYIRAFESLDFGVAAKGLFRFTLHSRVVEFLAAEMLRSRQDLGDENDLLTQTSWRDVTVTLLQTTEELPDHFEAAIMDIMVDCWSKIKHQIGGVAELSDEEKSACLPLSIIWPEHLYHLFSLLQDGFSGKMHLMPARIRGLAKGILAALYVYGSSLDRKHVMQIIGILPDELKTQMIELAIAPEGLSSVDEDALYFQIANLENIPPTLRDWVRTWIFINANKPSWLFDRSQRTRAFAYLARTEQLNEETKQAQFYTLMSRIDLAFILLMTAATTIGTVIKTWPNWWNGLMLPLGFLYYIYFLFWEFINKSKFRRGSAEVEISLASIAIFRSFIIAGSLFLIIGWQPWWILACLYVLTLPVTAILEFRHDLTIHPKILLAFSPLIYPLLITRILFSEAKQYLAKVDWSFFLFRIKYFPRVYPFVSVIFFSSTIFVILMVVGSFLGIETSKGSLLLNIGIIGAITGLMIIWTNMMASNLEISNRYHDQLIWKEFLITKHINDSKFVHFLTGFKAAVHRKQLMEMLLADEKSNSISTELLHNILIVIENAKTTKQFKIKLDAENELDRKLMVWIQFLDRSGQITSLDVLIDQLVNLIDRKVER